MNVLNEYVEFLWTQFQYDWSVFTNPWLLYTVVPAVLYLVFFCVKWWVLLVPITLPLTVLKSRDRNTLPTSDNTPKISLEKQISKILKG